MGRFAQVTTAPFALQRTLIRCLSAVYHRDPERSFFLAADQWTDAFLLFVNLLHAMHVRKNALNFRTCLA